LCPTYISVFSPFSIHTYLGYFIILSLSKSIWIFILLIVLFLFFLSNSYNSFFFFVIQQEFCFLQSQIQQHFPLAHLDFEIQEGKYFLAFSTSNMHVFIMHIYISHPFDLFLCVLWKLTHFFLCLYSHSMTPTPLIIVSFLPLVWDTDCIVFHISIYNWLLVFPILVHCASHRFKFFLNALKSILKTRLTHPSCFSGFPGYSCFFVFPSKLYNQYIWF
jgi:hypothetical protein